MKYFLSGDAFDDNKGQVDFISIGLGKESRYNLFVEKGYKKRPDVDIEVWLNKDFEFDYWKQVVEQKKNGKFTYEFNMLLSLLDYLVNHERMVDGKDWSLVVANGTDDLFAQLKRLVNRFGKSRVEIEKEVKEYFNKKISKIYIQEEEKIYRVLSKILMIPSKTDNEFRVFNFGEEGEELNFCYFTKDRVRLMIKADYEGNKKRRRKNK
jgi:hypothetical protein